MTSGLERHDEAIKLKEAGFTYAEIGRKWGVSKQRAKQIMDDNPSKPGPESSPLLTIKEAARLLHVHVNTLRRWSNQGALKPYRIGSRGDRRFKRTDIDEFLKGGETC